MELQTGELCRAGILVRLPPQPFKILLMLVSRQGQLVSREEIREQIWGNDTFVDFEHGLNFAINRIREALGDNADAPRYIQTLPRRGYRFIAPVELDESPTPIHDLPAATAPSSVSQSHCDDSLREHNPSQGVRRFTWRRVWAASGIFIAVTGLLLAVILHFRADFAPLNETRAPFPRIESIAVLPLENLSGDPQQEYFADGLTDTLITNLGQVLTMRVISRASVLRYKRGSTPLPEIARDLNVDAVVEGTVVRAGNRVRISVQLLDARTDHHLWAETYEREQQDVIALERDVALAIAHEISGRLSPAQETKLVRRGSVNLKAYDAYFRGRALFAERTADAETNAREYFEEALRADQNFTRAYSGLADFYAVAWNVKSDYALAEQYARKAVALDPDLAEGHASLGIAYLYEHKFPEAQKELETAITLNPNYALAHNLYADYWMYMGRTTEALAENSRAREIDPFSYPINFMRAGLLWYMGQTEQCIDQLQIIASLNPKAPAPHEMLVELHWSRGEVLRALEEQKQVALLAHDPGLKRDVEQISTVFAKSGFRAALLRDIELREKSHASSEQNRRSGHSLYSASSIAIQYALLKQRDGTLRWLEQATHEELGHLPEDLVCAREFDFVRSDPQFQLILHNLGVPTK